MGKIPKRYGPTKAPGQQGSRSKDMFGRNNDLRFSIRLAEVSRVDYENMVCDLKYIQGSTPDAEEVPISASFWTKRGFLGGLPSKGALAIVGFTAEQQGKSVRPLILQFLPNGLKTALRFDPFGMVARDAEDLNVSQEVAETQLDGVYGVDRRKMRKLYPGNVFGMSDQGAEILLNEGVTLLDRSGSELLLRPADSAGILTVKDLYETTLAGRQRFGRVVRNRLNVPTDFVGEGGALDPDHPLFDEFVEAGFIFDDGTLVPDINSLPSLTLPDGRKFSAITENQDDLDDIGTRSFTEQRTEIQEFTDSTLPFNEAHGFDADVLSPKEHFEPFIEKVTGTVVGNNPYSSGGRARYGQLLRPTLFNSPSANEGRPEMEVVDNTDENSQKNLTAASLYRMRRPDGRGQLFLSHDKEGHVVMSIPSSSSKNPFGSGWSVQAKMEGAAKVVMGKNRDGESLDLDTKGGMSWTIGTISGSQRSLDVKTTGGLSFDVQGSDLNGDAVKLLTDGNIAIASEGSFGISTSEDHIEDVAGKKDVNAESLSVSVGTEDYNTNVASDKNTTIMGTRETQIGQGDQTTILLGGEETDIIKGDSETSFLAPATRSIDFSVAGTHEITSGASLSVERSGRFSASYDFSAPIGSYEVSLRAGSVRLSVSGSSVSISPAGVTVKGPNIVCEGSVALGTAGAANSVVGGVPGPNPHIDYMTGAPIMGNPQVRTV